MNRKISDVEDISTANFPTCRGLLPYQTFYEHLKTNCHGTQMHDIASNATLEIAITAEFW